MTSFDPIAFHSALDSIFGFVGFEAEPETSTPHQSKGRLVRFPGSSIAAAELGVTRQHLHRVLIGERQSNTLLARWAAWLKANPQFARLQHR